MSLKLINSILPVLHFITSFYISFTITSCKFPQQRIIPLEFKYEGDFFILKNKVLGDLKYKMKKEIVITKDSIALSLDTEGKLLGYEGLQLQQEKKNNTGLIKIQKKILRQSTLWGIMKLTIM